MTTNIEILLDNSNSMGNFGHDRQYLLPDGSTRMALARRLIVDTVLPMMQYGQNITIKTFHSTNSNAFLVTNPIYKGSVDIEQIAKIVLQVPDPVNTGGTPISAAVRQSFESLAKDQLKDNKIILVTDGQETGNENYDQVVKALVEKYGIACNVFVVGIAQDLSAIRKSRALAQATNGDHVNLPAVNYDRAVIQQALKPMFQQLVYTTMQNTASGPPEGSSKATTLQTAEQSSAKSGPANTHPASKLPASVPQNSIPAPARETTTTNVDKNSTKELALPPKDEINDDEVTIEEDAEMNEEVRLASEKFLFQKLKEKYGDRVSWMNETGESGKPYDYEVIDTFDGKVELYIECKATRMDERYFLITREEWKHFLQYAGKYQLFLITSALSNPTVLKIDSFVEWLLSGKLMPLRMKNMKLKAERIVFTII